ncbi:relaxase/mobilization nuclease domain-containing protein [Enterococcus faecalis]|uniref:relaxase/mobilization nuclease domain-containing protein n=2 Tax=Enterococcus faecalis TaxID=1351 RepID=UPI002243BCA6
MATVKVSTTTSCSRAINYAEKRAEVKDGLNCDVEHAKQEMSMVREIHGKTDGTQAHLVIQSFSPEESQQLGAEKINQLGIELAEKIAPDHQIAVYTHVDKEHFHNHIVINSVNLETGKKYHQHKEFNHVKGLNDEILKQHHLEIVQPQKHFEKLTSAEVQIKRRGGTPWKDEVRKKIDSVMSDSSISSYQAFRERLEEKGVIIHDRGKNVTYELLEGNKRVRGAKLGSSYEKNTLKQEFNVRERKETYKKIIGNKASHNRRLVSSKNRYEYNLARFKKSLCVEFEEKLTERKGAMPRMNKDYFKTHKFKTDKSITLVSPVKFQRVIPKTIEPTRSLGKSLSL